MLPDLLTMIGHRASDPFLDEHLQAGVDFHLRVDSVFHETPAFLSWSRTVLEDLRSRGVSRGPARATAHIGVEMLIDACLTCHEDLVTGYTEALALGASTSNAFRPLGFFARQSLRTLCAHLLERGETAHDVSEPVLRLRLGRILGGRPRLAPTLEELEVISNYLSEFSTVRREMPALLDQLAPLFAPRTPGDGSHRPAPGV